jgi:acetoin utilization deacetylase AcuC-like enzyme
VAIIDWDVHHGNGTEDVFYVDPSVLYVSLHQDTLYPVDTGRVEERGSGAGLGATLNIPLPAGSSDHGYLFAFQQIVGPALASFGPELILISAGQDPAACDPLGRMSVTSEGFRAMTRLVCELADQLCAGRVVAVQEGGYSADYMPYCVLAIVEQLAGVPPRLDGDPLGIDVPGSIREWERDAVSAVARQLEDWMATR